VLAPACQQRERTREVARDPATRDATSTRAERHDPAPHIVGRSPRHTRECQYAAGSLRDQTTATPCPVADRSFPLRAVVRPPPRVSRALRVATRWPTATLDTPSSGLTAAPIAGSGGAESGSTTTPTPSCCRSPAHRFPAESAAGCGSAAAVAATSGSAAGSRGVREAALMYSRRQCRRSDGQRRRPRSCHSWPGSSHVRDASDRVPHMQSEAPAMSAVPAGFASKASCAR
jgi:hypothetical protein